MTNHAASNRQKLLNLSRETGMSFQEQAQYFAMSRFLCRLSKSAMSDRFILKGALLLHAMEVVHARSTLDIDLLGRLSNAPETIRAAIEAAIDQQVEPDGLEFPKESIEISDIARDSDYEGRRIRFTGRLGVVRIPMQIDIGFGDSLIPPPKWIDTPSLLGYESGRMLGYAPETSIAEKTHAIVQLGMLNSRMKDFYDIRLLSRSVDLAGDGLAAGLAATFTRRGSIVPTDSIVFTDTFFEDEAKQTQWAAFLRKRHIQDAPPRFSEIAREVIGFLKPFLARAANIQKKPQPIEGG